MAAGLQRDVRRGAPRRSARRVQGDDLRVRLAGALMPAFAHDDAVAHEHATDAGIGRGRVQAALGEVERAGHEFLIGRTSGHEFLIGGTSGQMVRPPASFPRTRESGAAWIHA